VALLTPFRILAPRIRILQMMRDSRTMGRHTIPFHTAHPDRTTNLPDFRNRNTDSPSSTCRPHRIRIQPRDLVRTRSSIHIQNLVHNHIPGRIQIPAHPQDRNRSRDLIHTPGPIRNRSWDRIQDPIRTPTLHSRLRNRTLRTRNPAEHSRHTTALNSPTSSVRNTRHNWASHTQHSLASRNRHSSASHILRSTSLVVPNLRRRQVWKGPG